jgi:hypothetical protein
MGSVPGIVGELVGSAVNLKRAQPAKERPKVVSLDLDVQLHDMREKEGRGRRQPGLED